jgi:hypothetical protein
MESKYKERTEIILFEERGVSYNKDGECLEHKSLFIEAMCQLAEEVEKVYKDQLMFGEDGSIQKVYSKVYVEELLQKQRELCAESAKIKYLSDEYLKQANIRQGENYYVSKNSILNAKLKID